MTTPRFWFDTHLRRAERLARRVRARVAALVVGHPIAERIFGHILAAIRQQRSSALTRAKQARRQILQSEFKRFSTTAEIISLPTSDTPRVSVVVVLWNHAALTLDCLRGLARTHDVPFELIIVDNGSTDATTALLDRVRGARVLRNDDNRGFLRAANQGAAAARGEYLAFLNNDAHLRPASLAAALTLIASDPTIGAVGGRVILPDGRLQEAGCIIWRDGTCVGYGRGLPPDAGQAMFRRDVDYCSGVFLMVRRPLFERLGGFDLRYAPAYYEDTDLCMRIWQAGLRVVYEPTVTLDHLEYGSTPTDAHALARIAAAHAVFVARWSSELKRHFPPTDDHLQHLMARNRATPHRRILLVDDRVPVPTHGAGYPRARSLAHALVAAGHAVTYVPIQFPDENWATIRATLPPTVEVMLGLAPADLERFLAERKGYHDTLFVSRPHNMAIVASLHARRPDLFAGLRIIYDAEAVFAARDRIRAAVLHDHRAEAAAAAAITAEIALADIATDIIAVTAREAAFFAPHPGRPVHVLGHALTPSPTPATHAERRGLLFVGRLEDDGSPNVDSLIWFVQQALDAIQLRLKQPTHLTAIGMCGAPSIRDLQRHDVHFRGVVADLVPAYNAARVFIAPTRFAGGIPYKVHEAAAHGVPVVATSLIAEQLGWNDGVELLVADDAATFARQIARLEDDADLWQHLRDHALQALTRDCDPTAFADTLAAVVMPRGS